jgi:hypothetical protein
MTTTTDELRAYTGASLSDDTFLETCLAEATALVGRFVGEATVPEAVKDRAVLEAASELFHRRQAPSGIAQFATVDGSSPIRVARDPMVAAYPILTPYVGTGIG